MKWLGGFVFLYIGLLLYSFADWNIFSSKISAYFIICFQEPVAGQCSGHPAFRAQHFQVLPDRQEVLHWMDGFNDIRRLTKCAVRDRKNWTCRYDDESAQFGFDNGRYSEIDLTVDAGKQTHIHQIYMSRFEWLKLQCGGWSSVVWCGPLLSILGR
jgi:hypothetical protein